MLFFIKNKRQRIDLKLVSDVQFEKQNKKGNHYFQQRPEREEQERLTCMHSYLCSSALFTTELLRASTHLLYTEGNSDVSLQWGAVVFQKVHHVLSSYSNMI